MTTQREKVAARIGWTVAASAMAIAASSAAMAQDASIARPTGAQEYSNIVPNENINNNAPAPGGALDSGITGIGQMVTQPDRNSFGIGLCTGTLINPRTVIFAAHCVNDFDASDYGAASGGIPISFGFSANNIEALRQWIGLRDPANLYQSLPDFALYNVEEVWYDPRSIPTGFLEADVALATLDTPAFGIPTWALLFSPLTEETHATIVGYGASGTDPRAGATQSIDFRRRIAENTISFLGSLEDRNDFLFGPDDYGLPQTLYNLDFDSPAGQGAFDGATNFDFDLFDGPALPREGTTAGGDSGGPLIVDQAFDRPVVAGVLSGGSRFFGPQPFSSYGTQSFYQPLFLFWDVIVANNPYKYVTNKAGTRDWTDPRHWVQTLDPAYQVIRDGQLVNGLPGSPAGGVTGNTTKFGTVCFLDDCQNFDQTGPENPGTGNGLSVPGGPGTTNFVPNNVAADPANGIRARYYDVTLSAAGTTRVTTDVEIDRLTLDGNARLEVRSSGSLNVLGDFTNVAGTTQVDGVLSTGEAFFLSGTLRGTGLFDPTFLTVAAGGIAPAGPDAIGTLTVQGDVILASGALTHIDLNSAGSDLLSITGDDQNSGIAALGGAVYFNIAGRAPRDRQSFTFLLAEGGIQGEFAEIGGGRGVLSPVLTYGEDSVTVTLRAGRLSRNLREPDALSGAFADALDALRGDKYSRLSDLYGVVDIMDAETLTRTLAGLAPRGFGETISMNDRQSNLLVGIVSDRLAVLGTPDAKHGQFNMLGAPETLGLAFDQTDVTNSSAALMSFAGQNQALGRTFGKLPENMTGFVSGGYESGAAGSRVAEGSDVRDSWHMAAGLEVETADRLTIGGGTAIVRGTANINGGEANVQTSQAIMYASYRLGGGAYVAGYGTAAVSDIALDRFDSVTGIGTRFSENTQAMNYGFGVDAGYTMKIGETLRFTPHAGMRYSSSAIDGYTEFGSDAALTVEDVRQSRLESRIGFSFGGETSLGRTGKWSVRPSLAADHVRVLDQGADSLTVRFTEAADLPIELAGFGSDTSWTEARGGLSISNGRFSFGAAFESDIGRSDRRDDRAVAEMSFRF